MATSPPTRGPAEAATSSPAGRAIAAQYARCTLGRSWKCRFKPATTRVPFENGRRRDPNPPATVSLLTNPCPPRTSASTIRMRHRPRRIRSALHGELIQDSRVDSKRDARINEQATHDQDGRSVLEGGADEDRPEQGIPMR